MQYPGKFSGSLPVGRALLCVSLLLAATDTALPQDARVTEVISLRRADAREVVAVVEALMPPDESAGIVTAEPRANALIVSGTAEFVQQIQHLLRQLDGEPEQRLIRIFPLSNRTPQQAAELLNAVLSDDPRVGDVNIVADEVGNALVVRATDEDSDYVQQLLRTIDTDHSGRRIVKVFALRNAVAVEAGQLLNDVWADAAQSGIDDVPRFAVAVDERTNSVIVMGQNEDVLNEVEALLVRLDEGEAQSPDEHEPLQVRILWIVSGDDWTGEGNSQPRLADMPDDLADVAGELDSLGISNPRIATQMVVNTSQEFSITGSARLENPIQVDVRGTVSTRSTRHLSRPALEIWINAMEQVSTRNPSMASLCQLETTLKAPLGHFVILGVSPIDARNSAFVVQVSGIVQ